MSKKEEKAKEYSFNIPSELFNTLENETDKILWKSDIEMAFEAGWDAAIDKACEWIRENFSETDHRFSQDFTGMLINSFRKAVEE